MQDSACCLFNETSPFFSAKSNIQLEKPFQIEGKNSPVVQERNFPEREDTDVTLYPAR